MLVTSFPHTFHGSLAIALYVFFFYKSQRKQICHLFIYFILFLIIYVFSKFYFILILLYLIFINLFVCFCCGCHLNSFTPPFENLFFFCCDCHLNLFTAPQKRPYIFNNFCRSSSQKTENSNKLVPKFLVEIYKTH